MPNDSRNNWELPCHLDAGSKLFPEAPDGQGLDFTEPNRDSAFTKHTIREGQKKGFKPVRIWLFSHDDAKSLNTGPVSGASGDHGGEDFYGDGGTGTSVPTQANPLPLSDGNLYNEMRDKVYVGPFTILAEYQPNQAEHVLLDFGVEKTVKEAFFFLQDDCKRTLGRQPFVGDIVERFDGKLIELVTSVDAEVMNWEWLYTYATGQNTNKDSKQLFRA